MKARRSGRMMFSSLTNNDLVALVSESEARYNSKQQPLNDDLAICRLKKEIQDLTSKDLNCETLVKQIRATEANIIELEKALSSQAVQTRQSREKLLHEVATIRTKLASQKRKLTELEGELSYVEGCSGEIKARLDARTCASDQSRTQLKSAQDRTHNRSLENQQMEAIKGERLQMKADLEMRLYQGNSRLASSIKALEAQKREIEVKIGQKKTMEECLQKLAEETENLRRMSKDMAEEAKITDQRMADLSGQLGEVQRTSQDKELQVQELKTEGFMLAKKLDRKSGSLSLAEARLKSLNAAVEADQNSLGTHTVKLEGVFEGQEGKENAVRERQEAIAAVANKRVALEMLGKELLTEMQVQVKLDTTLRNLLSAERIFGRKDNVV